MDNETIYDENSYSQPTTFTLSNESLGFLLSASKWAKFLSILGFINIGLILIMAFSVGSIFSMLSGLGNEMNSINAFPAAMSWLFTVIYIIVAAIMFFPVFYLFNFASKVQKAISNYDSLVLEESFKFLKSHYKFIGIVAIITLSIYGFMFFVMMMTTASVLF